MEETFAFSLRGRSGTVRVAYGANDDPERWGYGVLGLPWPSSLARGLPVLAARVETAAEGYEAVMGWIQVVRIHVSETSQAVLPDVEKAPAGDHCWVDGPPQLRGLGVPFVSFGLCPSLFDAPGSTESDVRFLAESFLTASPDALISRTSNPCFGLRWGYSTAAGMPPEVIPLSVLTESDWRRSLPVLTELFSDWMFEPDWLM